MEKITAKVMATATVEMIVTLRKFADGDIELSDVLEVLDAFDFDDIEIMAEID